MAAMFEGSAKLRDVLARPWIPPPARRAVATEIAQRSNLSKLSSDFVALLAERRRTDYLRAIEESYQKLLDADLGRVRVRVRAAVSLTDAQRGVLSAKLIHALGGRTRRSRKLSTARCWAASLPRVAAWCWMEVSRGSSSGCAVASRVARDCGTAQSSVPRRIR